MGFECDTKPKNCATVAQLKESEEEFLKYEYLLPYTNPIDGSRWLLLSKTKGATGDGPAVRMVP